MKHKLSFNNVLPIINLILFCRISAKNHAFRHLGAVWGIVLSICFFTVLATGIFTPLYAQEMSTATEYTYVVTEIRYDIQGRILEAALESKVKLQKGIKFNSLEDLLKYVTDKRIELTNLRQLTEMSTILFEHTWNESQQQYDVTLYVYATAGNTVLILPYFKLTNTSGLTLSMRGRDYNFLGSLEALAINLDYGIRIFDDNQEQSVGGTLGFKYPLKLKNSKSLFNIITEESASLNLYNADFENKLKVGLDYSYPLTQYVSLGASIDQRFISILDASGYDSNSDNTTYTYAENNLGYNMGFQLNKVPQPIINNIGYGPYIGYSITYPVDGANDPSYDERLNHQFSLGHGIGMGQIRWLPSAFFRKGTSLSLGNGYSYNINERSYTVDISLEAKQHFAIGNFMGINLRAYGLQNFFILPEDRKNTFGTEITEESKGSELGGRVRGIYDDRLSGSYRAFIINSDIMFKFLRINRFAEFHMGPLVDFIIRQRTSDDLQMTQWDADENIKVTLGLEGLAHALFANGIVVRGSLAYDLKQLSEDINSDISTTSIIRKGEIFIGLSLFY